MGRIFVIWFWLILFALPSYPTDTFLIPFESSEASDLLKKGEELEKQGEWQKAIACYQKVLHEYARHVVAVDSSLHHSAYDLALQRIWRLPPQALAMYQEQMQHQLAASRRQKDDGVIIPLHLTPLREGTNGLLAGIDQLLANERYAEVMPLLTEYLYQQTQRSTSQTNPDAAAMVARLAFCHFALGEPEAIANTARRYAIWKDETCVVAGRSLPISEYVASLLLRHQEIAYLQDNQASWPMLGKTAHRQFQGEEIPELPLLWTIPFTPPQRDTQQRYYYNETYRPYKGPVSCYPVLADNTLFLNNGKDVFAYHVWSGKLKWHFPGLLTRLKSDAREQVINSVTFHAGAIYANIEGETPGQRQETWSSFQIRKILPERKLVKLDATSGQLLWQVKDVKNDEEAFANKASFMSAPLVYGNLLYAGATELTGLFNSYLVAVQPDKGEIVWKTLIGSAQQELNMFGRPVREAVGSVVASGNGRLYYLNHLGACAAVEPLSGRLLWVYRYNRIPLLSPDRALFTTIYRETGFYNSPLILAGDSLFVAPIDGDELYCLDAFSGKPKWKRERQGHHHLMAVANGKVVLAGQHIELLDAGSGRPLKTFMLDSAVAGLGIAGRHMYIPTAGHLYSVDLAAENIAGLQRWPRGHGCGGHLAMADGIVASVSSQTVQVFANYNLLEAKWLNQSKEQPESPLPCLKLARLYQEKAAKGLDATEKAYQQTQAMYENCYSLGKQLKPLQLQTYFLDQAEKGMLQLCLRRAAHCKTIRKWDEAQQLYNKALTYTRKPEVIVPILFEQYEYHKTRMPQPDKVRACLQRLSEAFAGHIYYAPELHAKIMVGLYAIVLLARYEQEQNRPAEAVRCYQTIIERYSQHVYEGQNAAKWARFHLQRLVKENGQAVYAAYDKEAMLAYQNAVPRNPSSIDLLAIIERYPVSEYVPQLTLEMCKLLSQEGNHRDTVEYLRRFVREHAQTPQALPAYLILVQSYETMQMYDTAKLALVIMNRDYGEQTIQQQGRTITVRDYVEQKLAQESYKKAQTPNLPWLKLWDDERPLYQWTEPSVNNLLRLLDVSGIPATQHSSLLFLALGTTLYCRSGENGAVRWKSDIGWVRGVGFLGNRLFAWTRDQIIAIGLEQGNILWQANVPSRFVALTLAENAVAAVCHEASRDAVSVHIYDADSGKPRWQTEFPGKDPGDLLVASGLLFAFAKDPSAVYVYELANGKLRQQFNATDADRDLRQWAAYPVLATDRLLCLVRDNRWLECYRLPSLQMVWRYDGGIISLPSVTANSEYIAMLARNNQLTLIDLANGKTRWSWQMRDRSSIIRLLLDWESVYVLENKPEAPDTTQLWFLDIQNGSVQGVAPLQQNKSGNWGLILTQQHLVLLFNRWTQGWQSSVFVFDKFQGNSLRSYDVRGKDRGRTATEMCVRAGKLWLIKDNIGWALGEGK